MASINLLDNVSPTSVHITNGHGHVDVLLNHHGCAYAGSLRIKRNSVELFVSTLTTTLIANAADLDTRSRRIAEIFYSPTRQDLERAVRSGGYSLIATLKPYAVKHDQSFRNGNLKYLVDTCNALAGFLDRELECTSGIVGIDPRIRIRWHAPSEDPGFLKCISRWFGWRKWSHTMQDGCLLLHPDSFALSATRKTDDLDSLWLAAAGLDDPRQRLAAMDSAHEAIAAERLYLEEILPAAHAVRNDIARTNRMAPGRLEHLARAMQIKHRKQR